MTGLQLIPLSAIGLFAGVVGGMLGVGGSIVMIPALTEVLGPDQHLYQAAAMIVNFFIVVPAVMQHRRAGAIETRTTARLIPLAAVAVVAGVALSEMPLFHDGGEAYLRAVFGTFLLCFAGTELYFFLLVRLSRRPQGDNEHDSDRSKMPPVLSPEPRASARATHRSRNGASIPAASAAGVALPTGLLAGLLGIGGGVLAVPLQLRLLKMPMRNAVANSSAIIVATSLLGAMLKNVALVRSGGDGLRSIALAAVLIPTAIVGSLIGSRLTHAAPVRLVRLAFFLMLLASGIRMTAGALRGL